MSCVAIVQGRMSSSRFPGKVLCQARGKPLLDYLIERLKGSLCLEGIIIATSTDPSDDPIEEFCRKRKLEFYRGPLHNVANRFLEIVEIFRLNQFVRICADSPLIDPEIVDAGIKLFETKEYDIVTNCLKRTFPKGESVEIISSEAFKRGFLEMEGPEDYEHIMSYFYGHADRFRILNMEETSGPDYSEINLSIDTREDFETFLKLLGQMRKTYASYSWKEIVQLYEKMGIDCRKN